MAGWFTTIERRKEKKKTHHVSPLPVEKAIATSKCECVCVREEEEEIYRERERDSRRRNFDRFHGEKVYCSRVVNRS